MEQFASFSHHNRTHNRTGSDFRPNKVLSSPYPRFPSKGMKNTIEFP